MAGHEVYIRAKNQNPMNRENWIDADEPEELFIKVSNGWSEYRFRACDIEEIKISEKY